ncbi:MAG: TRZ/ATZ family hydrolase, partial [Pseudomonadota bacterium]|nr:TRZ/ATZ family hydrolase [Pseudomonadota bacterium]
MSDFDTVLHPDWVVPIAPSREVFTGCSVALKNGRIAAIAPRDQAQDFDADEHISLPHAALMPGLVNLHCHAAMALLRGYADDLPLMTWLQKFVWPTESQFISQEFVRDGSELAIADLLIGGTTTMADQYFFPEITAEVADRVGLRALLTFPVIDVETAWARDAESCINRGLALRDRYRDHDRIEVGFGPHSTYMVSGHTLSRVAMLAEELDAPIQIHLHETREEVLSSVERVGMRPIDFLEKIGLLGPRTQCVHMSALGDQDIATLAKHGAQVVHCPRSNLKLGSGICPVQKLMDYDINVALGTDGAASNNRLSMLGELQIASLIGKTQHGDPNAVDAWTSLEMATVNGAIALGQKEELGTIEMGKTADLIALDLSGVHHWPHNDIASSLVYATHGNEVAWSWIAGKPVVANGQLLTLDYRNLQTRAMGWSKKLSAF